MPITFDGPTLTITLSSGETQVAAQDIYSRWKDWVVQSDNAKYPPAFRTIGGDPLSAIINAGSYYFLQNQSGWRMRPPEEDITIYLSGNFVAEDSNQDAILPTIGPFTASVIGLQPVTQGVTPVMAAQLEFSSFQGGVWVDQSSGLSGTGYDASGEPIGNAAHPVDNFTDAVQIAGIRGLPRKLYVLGSATLDTGDDVSGFLLQGENAVRTQITVNDGAETIGCEIVEASVTGNLDGGTILRNCVLTDLNYVNGFVFQCMLNPGTITLGGVYTAHFLNCFSGVPGTGTPVIDMNGVSDDQDTPLAMRGYNGGIQLTEKTGAGAATIDLASGQVKVADSCTNGLIVVRGDGKVINPTTGDNMPSGTYNGSLTLMNEVQYGIQVQEVWQRLGLDKDNSVDNNPDGSFTVGGITVTAQDIAGTIRQTRS